MKDMIWHITVEQSEQRGHTTIIPKVLEGLTLELTDNYLRLEKLYYLQTKGTDMGSSAATAYVNIFVGSKRGCTFSPPGTLTV